MSHYTLLQQFVIVACANDFKLTLWCQVIYKLMKYLTDLDSNKSISIFPFPSCRKMDYSFDT